MFRILPYVIICAFAVVAFKVIKAVEDVVPILNVENLFAASDKPVEKKPNKKKPAKKVAKKSPPKSENNTAEQKTEGKQQNTTPAVQYSGSQYSVIEVGILKSLSKRRKEIESREKEVILKEASLSVIEERIQEKIAKITKLQTAVNKVLRAYEEKEREKQNDLVKIYENMKPVDAARIFEQLHMTVLLTVVENMKKTKLALIMAQMTPQRAKDITIELTNRRKLNLDSFR